MQYISVAYVPEVIENREVQRPWRGEPKAGQTAVNPEPIDG